MQFYSYSFFWGWSVFREVARYMCSYIAYFYLVYYKVWECKAANGYCRLLAINHFFHSPESMKFSRTMLHVVSASRSISSYSAKRQELFQ